MTNPLLSPIFLAANSSSLCEIISLQHLKMIFCAIPTIMRGGLKVALSPQIRLLIRSSKLS